MKINTVNVLEIIDGTPFKIESFKDNPIGNKQAEKLFKKIAKENEALEENLESFIEDGFYNYGDECGVYLIHS